MHFYIAQCKSGYIAIFMIVASIVLRNTLFLKASVKRVGFVLEHLVSMEKHWGVIFSLFFGPEKSLFILHFISELCTFL